MGRHINRSFISFLISEFKTEIQSHCNFCNCYYCKRFDNLHNKLEKWSFHNLNKNMTNGL